mmetsp:Transcript_61544/g.146830  ORF Transcript_61544/g.146830 Transcript_61544/m.146830 type:complete len:82 (+) Transcript_61544:592-837(+)
MWQALREALALELLSTLCCTYTSEVPPSTRLRSQPLGCITEPTPIGPTYWLLRLLRPVACVAIEPLSVAADVLVSAGRPTF